MTDARSYLLVIIQEAGHRRVFCPEFDIHFTVPVGDDPHRWTALTLGQMEIEIDSRLKRLRAEKKEIPKPLKWRDIAQRQEDLVGIQEASQILGVSPSTLRRLTDQKVLVCQATPGAHRRYSRTALERYRGLQSSGQVQNLQNKKRC